MNAQSRIFKFLFSPVIYWLAFCAIGSYFMFTVDRKVYQEGVQKEAGVLGHVKSFFAATRLEHVGKGIDLAGGTYLVLGVDLEKAIENRLVVENKALDQLFESKKLAILPKKKEIKKTVLELTFEEEEAAKSCFNLIQDNRTALLKVSRTGALVQASIAPEVEVSIRKGAVDQAVSVLTNRLASYDVEGIIVQPHGERQIVIQLPGINDPDRIKSVVTKTAHLEFKLVEDTAATRQHLLDKFDGELPPDKMIVSGGKDEGDHFYLVSAYPDLSGEHIVEAQVAFDQFNKPEVDFRLDSIGAKEFGDLTANNIGRRLAIIIDDVVMSSPSINSEIPGGRAQITGHFTQKDALDLSIVLKSGSLKAPLKFEQESRVGATLGQDSINKGFMACAVAILLLCLFSLLYYGLAGFFTVLALFYNLFLVLLFLSYFNATLTLPGIAGIVLTVAMAIDASIIIYERIREYLSEGESFRVAVTKGFQGATVNILDANITAFLTGLVLFQFGGPGVKGFAVTLMAGIIATVLSGVFFLKSIMIFSLDNLGVRSLLKK
ncbi:MAG: protein translocase subunit SecD [bacterium]